MPQVSPSPLISLGFSYPIFVWGSMAIGPVTVLHKCPESEFLQDFVKKKHTKKLFISYLLVLLKERKIRCPHWSSALLAASPGGSQQLRARASRLMRVSDLLRLRDYLHGGR